MLEQKLLEAWCADKTAEALRCQKLLEDEEEAAQKKAIRTDGRKQMKKLRQKEQRLKNLKDEDVSVQSPDIMDDATCSTTIQSVNSIYDPDCFEQEES
jgi:CHASE3 domain sensor protein